MRIFVVDVFINFVVYCHRFIASLVERYEDTAVPIVVIVVVVVVAAVSGRPKKKLKSVRTRLT